MEVPIEVKNIPLPGEDLQNTINTEIENLTECADVKDSGDIPELLDDVQNLVDNTYDSMTDEKTEEQLIEEQAAEAIAECTDVESKEQNESLSPDEVACEIISETPDDSFVLTLNASDLEETDKSSENIETTTSVDNKSSDKENVPTDSTDTPVESDKTTDVVNTPADTVTDNTPTDTVNTPTDTVSIPTDTVSIPNETVSIPTEPVSIPSETVSIPTETVSKSPDVVSSETISDATENPSDEKTTKSEPMEVTENVTIETPSVDEITENLKVLTEKESTDEDQKKPESSMDVSETAEKSSDQSADQPTDDQSNVTDIKPENITTIPSDNVQNPLDKPTEDTTKNTDDKTESESKPEETIEVMEVDSLPETTEIIQSEVKVLSSEETNESSNTVYIIEEITEPIIVDQQDLVTDDQKTTVIEVSSDAVIDSIEVIDSDETVQKTKPVDVEIINITEKPEPEKSTKEPIKPTVTKLQLPLQPIKTPIVEKSASAKTAALKARSIKEEFPNIPCHVLGRNIDNPQEDLVSNGRTPPKPRLGVKVPYRHLTSQIVSRQDIANELIELAAKRNPDPDPPIGGDVFFAKKLTSRLASKIGLKNPLLKKIDLPPANPSENINLLSSGALGEELKTNTTPAKTSTTITDNSDLLAILEGEVEVDLAKEVGSKTKDNEERPPVLTPENQKTIKKTTISNTPPKLDTPSRIEKGEKKILDPEIERIIALKQLEQFPKRSLRGRYRKQNLQEQVQVREKLIKEVDPPKESTDKKESTVKKDEPDAKKVTTPVADKKKKPVKTVEKPIIDDEDEPRLSYRKTTKTYSRKEPIVVVPPDLAQIVDEGETSQTETKTLNGETKEDTKKPSKTVEKKTKKLKTPVEKEINKPEVTLVSKRARIIKKKVIWDPDEVPQRPSVSPKKSVDEKPKPKKPEETKKDEDKPIEDKPEEDKDKEKEKEKEKEKSKEKEKPKEKEETIKKKLPKILTKAKVLRLKKAGKLILQKGVKGRVLRGTNGDLKSLKVIKKTKKQILKKRVKSKMSELDKLLADEGAINMLYNVRSDKKLAKKDVISLDKAQRELENRMKAVREVITSSSQEDSPKALRRKSPPALAIPVAPPPRKKSRDSLRSSIQSPPPSPSFIYPRAEASRIIRRHSSSFSSECSTPRRMSLDQSEKTETKPETTEKEPEKTETTPSIPKRKKGIPIYVRKADEKTYKGKQKSDPEPTKERLTNAEKRKLSSEMSKNFSQSTDVPRKRTRSSLAGSVDSTSSPKTTKPKKVDKFTELTKSNDENQTENEKRVSTRNTYKEISVRRIENLVQIILTPTTTKIKNAINLQMFTELCEMLTKLSKDDTCRVVLVSSTDNYFCHGIDFSMLMHANADKRLSIAQDTAKAVREFLMTLAQFPKPLVAGVQGPAVGLGVTMLPLFDLVLASDKATFATPYVKLGHVPEGAVLLASPHINGSVLTSELLFACRKLTASEALQHGLVTRVLWPDKFQEELIPIAKAVSKQSSQCMIATKRVLRKSLLANLQITLEEETKLLVEQWTSNECQQNFKKLLQENEWW